MVSQEAAELLNPNVRLAGKGRATSKRRLITSPGHNVQGAAGGLSTHGLASERQGWPVCD